MYVCNFLWNLHREQEWTLNSNKSLQRLSGWQVCLAWMCLVACTCVYSVIWLTRYHLNSTKKTAFKLWPRCGLSIEAFHFMNCFLRWRDHGCQKKKEEQKCGWHQWQNIYPIFPEVCYKILALCCDLDESYKESFNQDRILLKIFSSTISTAWLFSF